MHRCDGREPDVQPAGGHLVDAHALGREPVAGEFVATFGLLLVILGVVRSGHSSVAAYAVGGYIAAAYWFTSSTSFANPAVTVARTLTDTFAGIRPASAPMFIVMQVAGALCAVGVARFWHPTLHTADLVEPEEAETP